jgi:RNA polymerase primary sigma factor
MEKKGSAVQRCDSDALIEKNLRLVLKIANDFLGRGLPWDDLVSEGNRGLVIAAHRFDPDKGAKFSTYSAHWIKQAIRQAIAEQTQTVRDPVGTQLNSRRIKRSVRKLTLELDREPTNEEVAVDTALPLVTVERLRNTRQVDMQSLNEIVGTAESDGAELLDFIADDDAETPDRMMIKLEDVDQLFELLNSEFHRNRRAAFIIFALSCQQAADLFIRHVVCSNLPHGSRIAPVPCGS